MRNAECGMRSMRGEPQLPGHRLVAGDHSAFRIPHSALLSLLAVAPLGTATAQALPPLPDTTGFGVHVLALARAPDGAVWVGTYGQGIYVLRPGAGTWAEITDSAGAATAPHVVGRIASQYVLALAAGPDGSLWAAHLRGLARSADGGRTWSEFPEPSPCDPARCVNRIRALAADSGGVWVGTERGLYRLDPTRGLWVDRRGGGPPAGGAPTKKGRAGPSPPPRAGPAPAPPRGSARPGGVFRYDDPLSICDPVRMATAFLPLSAGWYAVGRPTGLASCRFDQGLTLVGVTYRPPADTNTQGLKHTWFQRPIALDDQAYIDQTYRYGSTMGGAFQQHQGVEFNAPDGTPVHAIGDGVVVFAGPAESGSLTVAIRHDRKLKADGGQRFVFSTYYHNSKLLAAVGGRVKAGDVIARVGNTV